MSEKNSLVPRNCNGFEVMRERLAVEYRDNIVAATENGTSVDTLSGLQRLHEDTQKRLQEAETELMRVYSDHGRDIGEKLVVSGQEAGVSDAELVRVVKEDIKWTIPVGLLLKDVVDSHFAHRDGDDTSLLSEDDILHETMNGINHRVAEHLEIE